MKTWTVHTKPGTAPEWVLEGFSAGAAVFGGVWLLTQLKQRQELRRFFVEDDLVRQRGQPTI